MDGSAMRWPWGCGSWMLMRRKERAINAHDGFRLLGLESAPFCSPSVPVLSFLDIHS
jgi:hypothetical protein